MRNDASFMQRAIELALQGQYTARPNPCVGCVIVNNDQIVGEGYHIRAGGPHAEIHALDQAGDNAKGATAYVTLEPCSHTNRTGPCCDALIAAGIKRLVCAMEDPNPKVAGQGIQKCKDAGIDVVVGVCEAEAAELNQGFLKAMRTGMPFVRVKMAASLDGKTALANGESKWITGKAARLDVQKLRARSGAIITGRGTVEHDQPRLTIRPNEWAEEPKHDIKQPCRIVCDTQFALGDIEGFITAHSNPMHQDKGIYSEGSTDLNAILTWCVANEYYDVLVEAGPTLAGSFVEQGLCDQLWVYTAPCIMGPDARPMLACSNHDAMAHIPRGKVVSVLQIGDDIRTIYR